MNQIRFLPRVLTWIVAHLLLINVVAFSQITLQDDLRRTVVLASPAQRVVSLAPSITETLFAIGAGAQVAGVTDYCDYPAAAQTKQRVGGIITPNIETIISLKPDLILVSMEGNLREDFDKLTSFGIPVFVTNPRTLDGIFVSIQQLGVLTGRASAAARLVDSLKRRANAIRRAASRSAKRTTLLFVSLQPMMVVGRGTFLAELLSLAGGINAAAPAGSTFPAYSREAVLKENPDVLIFMSHVLSQPAELIHLYPEWSRLKAFRRSNIVVINSDLVSRPGPRAVEGLQQLYTIIHKGE